MKLKEVIAGARFPLSRLPIEDALKNYSDVEIFKVQEVPNEIRDHPGALVELELDLPTKNPAERDSRLVPSPSVPIFYLSVGGDFS